jgi:hypothetical protein
MRKQWSLVLAGLALMATGASAQTVTGSGTTNTVPVFTGTSTVGNSPISVSSSKVGIGMASPNATLDVAGVVNGRNYTVVNTAASVQWAKIGTFTAAQTGETIRITAFIHSGFDAANSEDSTYVISFKTSNGTFTDGNGFAGNGSWYAVGFSNAIAPGDIAWVANAAGVSATSYTLYILLPNWTLGSHYSVNIDQNASWKDLETLASSPGAASSSVMIPVAGFNLPFGNVGVGTTAPAYPLDVAGQIHSSTGGYVFPDGTTQTTAFIPANCGADYAESVGVTGDRTKYEPGDILVIDPDSAGKFLKSNQPYSTLVSGIYSTKPGFVGRLEPAGSEASMTEVPMAMVGRVPTKVSAENGPVKVGDLLVTSSTLGYAMKGTDRSQMLGAVIGKALGSLDSGTGVIEVLVTLQ